MKKEDLKNSKIFVGNNYISNKLQDIFNKLGFDISYLDFVYIYVNEDYSLGWSEVTDPTYFINHEYKEVSAHDILQMEIELKPCPQCGSTDNEILSYGIICCDCGFQCKDKNWNKVRIEQ